MRCIGLALCLVGCSGRAADVGADAQLSVRGATFVRGALPKSTRSEPRVEAAFLGQTAFPAAFQGKTFTGSLGDGATAALVMLEGDSGYWIVPGGPGLVETPNLPTFDAPLSFSRAARVGPHVLKVVAVDDAERLGPEKPVAFTLTTLPLADEPLVFSLYWDRPSDLDLHVVLPDGTEVFEDEMNSWEPGMPGGPESGGALDIDSNPQCRIDGRNNENVIFRQAPPAGRYLVRVETSSLCGESSARFSVEARFHGERVALVEGQSLPTDTRGKHGRGAGTLAFELQVD